VWVLYLRNYTPCKLIFWQMFAYQHTNVRNHFYIRGSVRRDYINKIQRDATVCRCLFTANLLYMFRVSIAPIIRSTSNCNCSIWYRS
jgi:hypothetical protein